LSIAVDGDTGVRRARRHQRLYKLRFGGHRLSINRCDPISLVKACLGKRALRGNIRHDQSIISRPSIEPYSQIRAAQPGIRRAHIVQTTINPRTERGRAIACGTLSDDLAQFLPGLLAEVTVQSIRRSQGRLVLFPHALNCISVGPLNNLAIHPILDHRLARVACNRQRLPGRRRLQDEARCDRARCSRDALQPSVEMDCHD